MGLADQVVHRPARYPAQRAVAGITQFRWQDGRRDRQGLPHAWLLEHLERRADRLIRAGKYVDFGPGNSTLTMRLETGRQLWNVCTGKPVGGPFSDETTKRGFLYSPDGRLIATAGRDNFVRLWDAATVVPVGRPIRLDEQFQYFKFSPDGRLLVLADKTSLRCCLVDSGTFVGVPVAYKDRVNDVRFSADSRTVAITDARDSARRYRNGPAYRPFGEPGLVRFRDNSGDPAKWSIARNRELIVAVRPSVFERVGRRTRPVHAQGPLKINGMALQRRRRTHGDGGPFCTNMAN